MARVGAAAAALMLAAVAACSGGPTTSAPVGDTPDPEVTVPEEERTPALDQDEELDDAEAEPGTVQIKVVWPKPAAALLRSPGRNACGGRRRAPLQVEPAGVIADRYAFERIVAVSGAVVALEGVATPAPDGGDAALLAVRGCAIEPRAVAVAAGASFSIVNAGETRQRLRVTPTEPPETSDGQDAAVAAVSLPVIGHRVAVPTESPGVLRIATEADPLDAAYAFVADTGWVAVTDAAGVARFRDVPPGRYQARVWHPPLAPGEPPRTTSAEIEVPAGKAAKISVPLNQ